MDVGLPYGGFSMESLGAAVTKLTDVRSLDLSGNNISPDTMVTIVESFITHMVNLEELDLKSNKMGPRGAECLCNAIRKNCHKLRYLDLSENGILDESLLHVAYLLQDNCITSLFLVSNHLTPLGIATLCDGILSTNYIHELVLAFNVLGDEGTSILAKALTSHPSLCSLDISDNGIGDNGAVAIATYLIMSPNSRLENLNLSVNRIGDVGFAAIAEALVQTTNSRLKKLDLGCNVGVGEAGREAFIKNVGSMRHLSCLDLCSSNLSDQDAQNLTNALSSSTCGITRIEWYNNPEMKLETEKVLFMVLKSKEDALRMNEKRRRQLTYFAGAAFLVALATGVALVSRRMRR